MSDLLENLSASMWFNHEMQIISIHSFHVNHTGEVLCTGIVQKISWLLKKIWLTTSVCFCWYIQGELSHVFIRYWHISPTKEAWPPSPLRNDILDTDRPQIERFLISENAILLIHQYHRHLILPFLHNKYASSNYTEHSKTKSSLLMK